MVADRADLAVLQDALEGIAEETAADPLLLSGVRLELGLGFLWPTTLHHDLDRLVGCWTRCGRTSGGLMPGAASPPMTPMRRWP